MIGTVNQIAWAEQIKIRVSDEFDRVRRALESRLGTQALVAILEEKRAEVMAHEEAGYFIHDWEELRGQVRALILEDPRYKALRSGR